MSDIVAFMCAPAIYAVPGCILVLMCYVFIATTYSKRQRTKSIAHAGTQTDGTVSVTSIVVQQPDSTVCMVRNIDTF